MQLRLKLNDGRKIPIVGLGTYLIAGNQLRNPVIWAVKNGYRHIDSAEIYRSEAQLGKIVKELIKENVVKREDLFIASKIAPIHQGTEKATAALKKSLSEFGLDYLDLMMIHWPGVQEMAVDDPNNAVRRRETWKVLEESQKKGLVRSIGVSNFTIDHLEDLCAHSCVVPAVNQVEMHPHCSQPKLREYCKEKGIVLVAYGPLGYKKAINDPVVLKLAEKYNKQPAQICLRWAIQHGVAVIPKSAHENRIAANIDIFDFTISPEDMAEIDALDKNSHYVWNPETVR